jgi:hypothetical protein
LEWWLKNDPLPVSIFKTPSSELTPSESAQTIALPDSPTMAEGVGFEPTEPCGSPVFKTGAIDHSTTPPVTCVAQGYDQA